MMYAQDYDGRIMAAVYYTSLPSFQVLLQPYVKSYQIFRCPSTHSLRGTSKKGQYGPTYGLPGIGNTAAKKVIYSRKGTPLSSLTAPSRTFMIVETCYSHPTRDLYVERGYGYATPRFDNNSGSYWHPYRHLDGTNVAFADGHTKWLKYTGTYYGTMKNWVYTLSKQP